MFERTFSPWNICVSIYCRQCISFIFSPNLFLNVSMKVCRLDLNIYVLRGFFVFYIHKDLFLNSWLAVQAIVQGKERGIESVSERHYILGKKGGWPNPPKRFRRKVKASKCIQSLKKRIKNSAEPFEGSDFYPMAEPSLAEPFLSSAKQKKLPSEKYKTFRV